MTTATTMTDDEADQELDRIRQLKGKRTVAVRVSNELAALMELWARSSGRPLNDVYAEAIEVGWERQ